MVLGSPNLCQGSTWMMSGPTLKIKVIEQRSRLRGQKCFSRHSAWTNLDQCLSMQIDLSSMHSNRTMYIARVHRPPMNKFACKLHGYIVYFKYNAIEWAADQQLVWGMNHLLKSHMCCLSRGHRPISHIWGSNNRFHIIFTFIVWVFINKIISQSEY